ncbi:TrbG/VirB9 family P-type conjugative transfer protein [Novosphingobium decolorationis]|uniref:TrbG/VirB9 family P-type conjugative transfer protein n=1 Tax=Novosphingobium decolorationis TaxID=2698673 RepID=A0ABX8E8J1_9SPHN|nr:TrbG/VirB9 family P-type conjugative transfer protein [Novosphingobium decolorationis]QVM85482.1 TrbG/VirB9 family P-type conjugative transfer protein [Novosphingobium decolorationis]
MTHAFTLRTTFSRLMLGSVLAAGLLSAPVRADDRLVEHAYRADEVVTIPGRTTVQATIAFGRNEAIENVAVGDSSQWQITPNKRADLLFVKPLETSARTNMTVVTNKRTYFFDLVAGARAKPLYMLRFTYADEEEPVDDTPLARPSEAERLAHLDPAERAVAEGDPLAMPAEVAALNFAWERKGAAKLQPVRVYDDGQATYLVWPEQTPNLPAILVENEKGDEGPVNYAVRGPTIVVSDVPDRIILRRGKDVAELLNTVPLGERPAPALAQRAGTTPPVSAQ